VRPWSARPALEKTAVAGAILMLAVFAAGSLRDGELIEDGAIAVTAVIDGDTIELASGRRVRLAQIDAPEAGEGECWGQEATAALQALLPEGSRVRLARDGALDEVDRFDRLLRYVFTRETNVNLALVRRGAASVWFFDGARGRYARELLQAARAAKSAKRGLWGGCRDARFDPESSVRTGPE
jgi:micrococcal nuclease